ncbi:unnamed protein product, partial [Mesorhabditis belari]|uniref:C-type lectin n=1 Tax=Mesorhabditis belari TaxID=2138241 RepID=A0AAF3EIY4_9BILA
MKLTLLGAVLLNVAIAQFSCPAEFTYNNALGACLSTYTFYSSWSSANFYCNYAGASLLSVHNAMQNSLYAQIQKNQTGDNRGWLGLTKNGSMWMWTDGTPFDYNRVQGTQGNCVYLDSNDLFWKGADCSVDLPFLCTVPAGNGTRAQTTTQPSLFNVTTTNIPNTPANLNCQSVNQQSLYTCQQGWQYFPTTGYQYMVIYESDYNTGEAYCVSQGGHLASVHSAEENNFITNLCCPTGCSFSNNDGRYGQYVLGAYEQGGSFFWSDGTPFDYSGSQCFDEHLDNSVLLVSNYLNCDICGTPGNWFWEELYFGSVLVGNPGQTLTVDFDTGSDMFWVPCNCKLGDIGLQDPFEINSCASHTHVFNPKASKTNRMTSTPFSIQYGSGFVDGRVMYDRLCIPGTAHCTPRPQKMGCTSFTDSGFRNAPGSIDSDGLMGLAYVYGKMGDSLIRSIFNSANCKLEIFAFYLSNSGDKTKSEMTICGTDPAHYIAPLRFLSVDKSSYYWTVALSRVQWGGKTQWTKSALNAVLFDTGTTGIYLPGSLVNKIESACGKCSCPTLIFTLNGHTFSLPGSYYVDSSCTLLIFSSDEISIAAGLNAQWILGDAFLRRFYSVYDYAHGRVGLAPRR